MGGSPGSAAIRTTAYHKTAASSALQLQVPISLSQNGCVAGENCNRQNGSRRFNRPLQLPHSTPITHACRMQSTKHLTQVTWGCKKLPPSRRQRCSTARSVASKGKQASSHRHSAACPAIQTPGAYSLSRTSQQWCHHAACACTKRLQPWAQPCDPCHS